MEERMIKRTYRFEGEGKRLKGRARRGWRNGVKRSAGLPRTKHSRGRKTCMG